MRKYLLCTLVVAFFNTNVSMADSSQLVQLSKPKFGDHFIGVRVGYNISGFTSLGFMNQDLYSSVDYGIQYRYKFNRILGVTIGIGYTEMGNQYAPMELPFALTPKPSDSGEGEAGELSLDAIMEEISESVKEQTLFRENESLIIKYLCVPITLSLSFRGHPESMIQHTLEAGPQFNFKLSAERIVYKTPSLLKRKTKEVWVWEWTDTENCEVCGVQDDNISDEIPTIDAGLILGYKMETDFGLFIGASYYTGFRKVFYLKDQNSFARQRRNFSFNIHVGYNILSILNYF